jgi:hypothetical protein
MAQVDHVVDARAKEIVGGGAGKHHGKTPRKLHLLEIKLGVQTISNHPESPVFMRVSGVLQGRRLTFGLFLQSVLLRTLPSPAG